MANLFTYKLEVCIKKKVLRMTGNNDNLEIYKYVSKFKNVSSLKNSF